MNTYAIIAAIIALIGGVIIGTNVKNNDNLVTYEQRGNQGRYQEYNNDMIASDYVSTRPGIASLPAESLSTEEKDGLLLMREEEKLARDVYQTLYDKWGLRIFANIAQSEQTHTEAVRDLLVKYDLTDPVTDDAIGVFVNSDLKTLYDSLVEKGLRSENDALIVGATIEDLDIKDLQNLTNKTDNADIKLVYENLTRGSRNHLRAFTRQLDARGLTYEPSYISTTEYENIISSNQENGGAQMGGGKGNRGWGNRNN